MRYTTGAFAGLVLAAFAAAAVLYALQPVDRRALRAQPTHWLVDVNRGDAATLTLLPGVGPHLAQRIIARRQDVGPFRSVEELAEISGIGPVTLAALRPYATCGAWAAVTQPAEGLRRGPLPARSAASAPRT